MNSKGDYIVNAKENVYFLIRLLVSAGLYGLIFMSVVETFKSESPATNPLLIVYIYVILILSVLFLRLAITIGYIRGNAVKVTSSQFPDIHQIVV